MGLEVPAQVRLTGKGRKARAVPLMSSTVDLLRDYLHEQGLIGPERLDDPLFRNRFGGRLSRSGIRYLVEKYVRKAGATRPVVPLPKVSPHTFRHSKAMHLLQADNPLVVTFTNDAAMTVNAPAACVNTYFSMPALTGVTATGGAGTATTSPATDSWTS